MQKIDLIALILFLISWLGYEPILRMTSKKRGTIIKDLTIVRLGWIRTMISRDGKIFDANLLGHSINSASFFASANLILIAAIGGALFGGKISTQLVGQLGINSFHFQIKMGLVLICLTRGFLNFIWAIRQMNYCAAAFGAIPNNLNEYQIDKYTTALGNIIEPAMSNFSHGVRGYYFALAAGAWLYGPWFLIMGSVGAFALLVFRQSKSQSAKGLRQLRDLIENNIEDKQI